MYTTVLDPEPVKIEKNHLRCNY